MNALGDLRFRWNIQSVSGMVTKMSMLLPPIMAACGYTHKTLTTSNTHIQQRAVSKQTSDPWQYKPPVRNLSMAKPYFIFRRISVGLYIYIYIYVINEYILSKILPCDEFILSSQNVRYPSHAKIGEKLRWLVILKLPFGQHETENLVVPCHFLLPGIEAYIIAREYRTIT